MFRYLTSYRFYTLAKVGLGLAYLWFIWDFFQIHLALWGRLSLLLPISDHDPVSVFLNSKILIWGLFLTSPLIAALYVWGQHRWLQFAVGLWMSLSMVIMISFVGVFASTADVWLHFIFLAYCLAALICPTGQWDQQEPGFDWAKWDANPVIPSTYTWMVVFIQFTVYLFAGINKLVDGWEPWTTGIALQNLAFDSSMHDYAHGIVMPCWLSLALCYVTLFQRLVVPLGFYYMRYRGWSVLILGAMHVGYDLLMQVAIFPLIGVSSLLMIIPPRSLAQPLLSRPSFHQPREVKRLIQRLPPITLFQGIMVGLFSMWLLCESLRVTVSEAMPWEKSWMVVPAWRMFADGGVTAGEKWKLLLQTPGGKVDATEIPLQVLPHLWRDRFYIDVILHSIPQDNSEKATFSQDTLTKQLLQATDKLYREQQLQAHKSPFIINGGFVIYSDRTPHSFSSQ